MRGEKAPRPAEQVKVTGLHSERYVLLCNGRQTPLTPVGPPGQFIAGVRFRAWQPASALHPTIGVHAPLTFDLYDTANLRVVGGCTYYVAHPGGWNYETLPVTSNEAEARRRARFEPFGHAPAAPVAPMAGPDTEYPSTLDLRRWAHA